VNFCKEIINIPTNTTYNVILYVTNYRWMNVQNFKSVSDKFNTMGISTSESYMHKGTINCIIMNLIPEGVE
jgi:hypothetical protein